MILSRNLIFRSVGAFLLAGCIGGCLNYQRPPLAVDAESFTKLQDKEKNVLPADLKFLTLKQAQELAVANNPDFLSVRFTIDSAEARFYQQFSSYAPTLNAGMSISQSFNKIYAADNHSYPRTRRENYSPALSGRWLIFDSLGREMRILAAKHELAQTQANVDDAHRLLMRATAYAYNDVQLAYAQREIVQAQIEYNQNMLDDARRKYDAGTALLSDVLNFHVALRNAQLDLVRTNYNIKANLYVLAGYMGLTDGTIPETVKFPEVKMPPEEYLGSIEIYLDSALANRPDLKALRERLKVMRYNYYGSFAAFGPTATFNYGWGYDHSRSRGGDSGGSWSSSGNFNYSFNIDWNLFNGFNDFFNVKIAGAGVSETDYLLYGLWLSVITDVRTAYDNHISSIKQAKLSQEICELTKRTRDLVENEYNAGTALVTRLNEAERDLVAAQNDLVTAIVNIANSRAQLEAAVYSLITPPQNETKK